MTLGLGLLILTPFVLFALWRAYRAIHWELKNRDAKESLKHLIEEIESLTTEGLKKHGHRKYV